MNDERFLKDWLRDTTDSTADPNAAADKVVARLPESPQRRCWLPWPPARRPKPNEPNGRTRPMLSPVKMIAAGAIVALAGGLFLVADPVTTDQATAPGAEDPTQAPPSIFEGDIGFPLSMRTLEWATAGERADGSAFDYGAIAEGISWSTDDPRITGRLDWIWNEEAPPGINPTAPSAGGIATVLMRIVNDEGAWTGTATGLGPGDPAREMFSGWLAGEGAYDGLTAYVVMDDEGVFGYITPHGPPPVPEGFPSDLSE